MTMARDQLPAFKVFMKGVQVIEHVGADPVQLRVRIFFGDRAGELTPRMVAARLQDPEYVTE